MTTHSTQRQESYMKSGKTPYEIRLDLLRLAFDILQGKALAESKDTNIEAPSSDDVIREATKLNTFVSPAITAQRTSTK